MGFPKPPLEESMLVSLQFQLLNLSWEISKLFLLLWKVSPGAGETVKGECCGGRGCHSTDILAHVHLGQQVEDISCG